MSPSDCLIVAPCQYWSLYLRMGIFLAVALEKCSYYLPMTRLAIS